eukprot:TRINITY_DN16676_c0_g2_i1.p1 TRINITY_DN16676_c0_g2~~TRINITY_DN16676_c0_g2_i1.p1  ORF type:complete len:243 (-),score=40.69 TRINITY_DN16676_c0_g2_i1:101-829(-)
MEGMAMICRDVTGMSVAAFKKEHYLKAEPVVLVGSCAHWKALEAWNRIGWIESELGHRTVPVELGRHLEGEPWSEDLMTIQDFVRNWLLPSARRGHSTEWPDVEHVAYIAQHSLVDQIPELRQFFKPPAYVNVSRVARVNCWLGTAGTVTPLHFDSYDNLLAQAVGWKYLILFDPSESEYLYTSSHPTESTAAQGNLSPVQPETPDLQKYPLFPQGRGRQVILGPGDVLFIPKGHWLSLIHI